MSAPYDPHGEAPTTPSLVAIKRTAMLNQYKRLFKVGGGHHGTVFLCLQQRKNEPDLAVAMKSVKRAASSREEQLRQNHDSALPRAGHGLSVADKVTSAEEKVRKEIAIMKKLRHPHVVRLYEIIDDRMQEKIYIVMEYLGGGEVLWQDSDKKPLLAIAQTRRIMRDALLGLEYLHYQGIIHRDIKPANLLYTLDRSHVKIGDFGVSHFSYAQRLAALGSDSANEEPADRILLDDSALSRRAGTPVFLAPEIIWEYRGSGSKSSTSAVASSSNGTAESHTKSAPAAFVPDSASPLSSEYDPGAALRSFTNVVSSPTERPAITKAIDVWALGITFYCLLTGKTPYEINQTVWRLYHKISTQNIELTPTLGADALPVGDKWIIDGEKGQEKEKELSKGEGKQKVKEEGEGPAIRNLLERFLQRVPSNRVTLEQVKTSKFILTDLDNIDEWLSYTSPEPTPRIYVDQNEASQAMSAVRFRADWGTRLVRQFSSLWSKRGSTSNSTSHGSNGLAGGRLGAVSSPQTKPHLKRLTSMGATTITAAGPNGFGVSSPGGSGTLGSAVGRHMAAGVGTVNSLGSVNPDALKSSPAVVMLDKQAQPTIYRPPSSKGSRKALNQGNGVASGSGSRTVSGNGSAHGLLSSPSPVEGKSMGWWRRNVAGILTWSPDRYPNDKEAQRQRRKEERKRLKKGKMPQRMEDDERENAPVTESPASDHAWGSDVEVDAEFDPLATSRTFDSYRQQGPHPQNEHGREEDEFDYGQAVVNSSYGMYDQDHLSPVDSSVGNGTPAPPFSRRSEEALRMYRPSPSSSEDTNFFTAARRASSWGQGDKTEYEVQSITSDVVPAEGALDASEQVMWRGSEGLYVVERGVLVQVPPADSPDDDDLDHALGGGGVTGMSAPSAASDVGGSPPESNSSPPRGGPGPSTAWHRAALQSVHAGGYDVQANVQRLTPILDTSSSNKSHRRSQGYERSVGGRSRRSRRSHKRRSRATEEGQDDEWSDEDEEDDDDDDASSDHALTFSPSRRPTQSKDYVEEDNDDVEETVPI